MALRSVYLLDLVQEIEEIAEPHFWFYRGEGNDSIVVSLKGHSLVLRLKKKNRNTMDNDRSDENSNDLLKIHKSLDFNRLVFLPLMGGSYVRSGQVVQFPPAFAEKLDKICESFRPKERLHKGIDTKSSFGILMPDFCFLPKDLPNYADEMENLCRGSKTNSHDNPAFSVEIKPKCGFLPSSPFIKDSHSIRRNICYYCLLQGVKVDEGKYSRRSKYCPVDFLSGDSKRVFYALKALASDPQNNLRIFKDGSPIFSDEIVVAAMADASGNVCCSFSVLEEALKDAGWKVHVAKGSSHRCDVTLGPHSNDFMLTVLQILIDDSKPNEQYISRMETVRKVQVCNGNGLHHFKHDDNEALQKIGSFGSTGVLKYLSQVQRMDDIDVEGLFPLYLKLKKYFEANISIREQFSVDGPYNADIWKQLATSPASNTVKDKPLDMWTIKDIVSKLCQFSVASTAKDCSLMLALQAQATKPKHLPYIEVNNSCDGGSKVIVAYNIDLVDLDPKEFDRVQKYFKDNCKTVQHYIEHNGNHPLGKMWWSTV